MRILFQWLFGLGMASASFADEPSQEALQRYQVILSRNPFGLKPPAQASPTPAAPAKVPKGDLFLTGMTGLGSRRAMFLVTEPGQPLVYFMLREGEENHWLAVKAVNPAAGTVTVCLKQPVMRIRNVGVEVLLSFPTHGVTKPKAQGTAK